MATLKTRIQNKYGTATEWGASTLQLLKGELAIMPITTYDSTVGYMIKIGDGTHTFTNSNYLVAYAADVHAWAKKETLEYADLPQTLKDEIDVLQEAIGNGGSVGDMIKAAIQALDVEDADEAGKFVSVVSEVDGKISVQRKAISKSDILDAVKNLERTDLVNINQILTSLEKSTSDLSNALGGSYSAENTVANAIKALSDSLDTHKTSTSQYGSRISTLESEMDTAEGKITALENELNTASTGLKARVTTAEGEIDGLQAALAGYTAADAVKTKFTAVDGKILNLENVDLSLDTRLQAVEGQIGGVTGAMHFIGAFASAPTTGPSNKALANGDVYVNTANGKEFVYNNSEWVELGDVSEESARIGTLEKALTGYTTNSAVANAFTAEKDAREAADTTLQNNINTLSKTVTALDTAYKAADTTLQTNITTVANTIGGTYDTTNTVAKKITEISNAVDTNKGATETNAADIDKLEDIVDGYTTKGSIKTAITEAKTAGTNAQSAVDTLAAKVGTSTDGTGADTVYGALAKHADEASKTYATKTALNDVGATVTAIEAHYVYSDGTNLKTAAGDTIIFDCGGVN